MRIFLFLFHATLCIAAHSQSVDRYARAVEAHASEVVFLAAKKDLAVSASANGRVIVHALPSLREFASVEIGDRIVSCGLHGDGLRVVTAAKGTSWFSLPGLMPSAEPGGTPSITRSSSGDPDPTLEGDHSAEIRDETGALLAAASWNGTLRILRGERVHCFRDDVPPLMRMVFTESPTAGPILAADDEGRVWFVPHVMALLFSPEYGGATMIAARSPGGFIATGSTDSLVRIFAVDGTMTTLDEWNHQVPVTAVAFMPTGQKLISADSSGDLRVHVPGGRTATWSSESPVNSVAGHGDLIAIGHRSGAVVIRSEERTVVTRDRRADDRSGAVVTRSEEGVVGTFEHEDDVKWVAFSPDGRRLASTSDDGDVRVWDLETGDVSLGKHPRAGHSVDWSPDGRHVASGCLDGRIRIWDVTNKMLVTTLGPFGRGVNTACYDATGKRLVVASSDGAVTVVDRETGTVLGGAPGHDMAAVWAEFTGEDRVVAAYTDGFIIEFDWRSGKIVRRLGRTASRVEKLRTIGTGTVAVELASGRKAWWTDDVGLFDEAPDSTEPVPEPSLALEIAEDDVIIARQDERVVWIRCVPRRPRVSAITSKHVVLGCDNGILVFLERETGRRVARVSVEESE